MTPTILIGSLDLGDRLQHAGDIRGMVDGDQDRLGAEGGFQFRQIEFTRRRAGDDGDRDLLRFERPERPHHGVVLEAAGDDVVTGLQAEGEDCAWPVDCAEGLHCSRTDSCPGTCQPFVGEGGACTNDGEMRCERLWPLMPK